MAEIITKDRKEYNIWDKINSKWNRLNFLTNAKSVDFDDGKTAQTKLGAIDGITSDLSGESETVAASIKCVNQLNSSLGGLKFGTDGEGNYGYFGDDDVLIPFNGGNLVILGYANTPNGTYSTLFVADKNYDHVYVVGQSFNVFLKNGNAYSPTNLVNTAYYSSIYDLEDIKAGNTISVNGGSTGTHSSTAFVIV